MLARPLLLSVFLALAASGVAHAQAPGSPPQPPTQATAQSPTLGALYRDGQTNRYLLGGTWLYRPDPTDAGLSQGWSQSAARTGFSPVTVPNAYNAGDLSTASMNGSVGWYRRDFTLPTSAFSSTVPVGDRRWIIRFESVNERATVWLNGRKLGSHTGAYLPFELDLSGIRPGLNRLVVRVDDHHSPSDLPPGPQQLWWNYGGILREVYLRPVQRADIASVQVRPLLPCPQCAATIEEQVVLRNVTAVAQTVQLRGQYGSAPLDFGAATIAPHGIWTGAAAVIIPKPRLWAPGSPKLYRATLKLSDSQGNTLGGYLTDSGIRSITTTPDGRLELNGRLLNLRGVDLHEQDIATGAALNPAQLATRMAWIRKLGASVIRAHYPLSPQTIEMADRNGILIWSEIPVYQLPSAYLAQPAVLSQAQTMLAQNILTDQNHPSILLWSIGNELATPADAPEARYIAAAAALAHKLDPTRPVGLAISATPGVPCQPAYAPLDVLGFNDYFGWFDAGGGSTDDRDQLGPYLDSLRACYPTKPLFLSEFGFEANRSGPAEERGTYAFQSNAIGYHLFVFGSKPWLSGAMYWVLQDFASRPGWGGGDPWPDPPFVQKGLVDLQGNFKPAFSLMASIYHGTLQIAPEHDRKARRSSARRKHAKRRARARRSLSRPTAH